MTGTPNPTATVFLIGFDGVLKNSFTYDTLKSVVPKDIYVDRNMIYVSCEIVNQITLLRSPLFFVLDTALRPQWAQQPDVTDYEFIAMFPAASGFIALYNGIIGGEKYPVLCRFTKLNSTEFSYLKQRISGNRVFASDMIPSNNGSFLILISDESDGSSASVIKVSSALKQTDKVSLEVKQSGGGKLFFGNGSAFYAVVNYVGNARGRLVIDGAAGLSVMQIDGLADIGTPADHMINTGNALFLSTADIPLQPSITLTVISPSLQKAYQNAYGGTGIDRAVAFYPVSDGVIIFGNSDSIGGDAGGNFGRADVWVFKVTDR